MEVIPGYKLTEAGVIPEDWSATQIGQVAETGSGTTPARANESRYFAHGTHNWVKTLDLNNRHIRETDERVTDEALRETSLRIYPVGTVLVAMYGGFAQIGRTGLLTMPAAVNQALVAIRTDKKVVSQYLLAVLNHRVAYWQTVAASSRKDPNITKDDVRAFPIALPPTRIEQEAIAEVLSDADALIESLEQLIAKKRQIKQGVTQELLTGKRRLPGFEAMTGMQSTDIGEIPRDWEYIQLTTVAKLESGHTPSRKHPSYWDGDVPWISLHDTVNLNRREIFATEQTIGPLGLANSSARILPKGTVVFSRTATIGKVSVMGRDMATSQDFANYICGDRICNHFLAYVFRAMGRKWAQLMAGSIHNTIYMPVFEQLQVQLPTVNEQHAIAFALAEMDEEIEVLIAKLQKARQLKQGMMHNLLTGKIRLV